MHFKKHDKETLDAIGKRLLAEDVMPAGEIDRTVANPYLFAKIRQRQQDIGPAGWRVSGRYSAVFAGIAVFAFLAVASIGLLRPTQEIASVPAVEVPADVPVEARPANLPPRKAGSNPSQGRANYYREAAPERITARTADYTIPKARRYAEPEQDRPQFYPINYTGDPGEITSGSHIVRVDMPRRSLFALGVNVPIENDSETVKADLLVGADGVTRAIRVLK